jgi:hypothetical protein
MAHNNGGLTRSGERGTALLASLVIVTMILSFMLAGLALVTMKSGEAKAAENRMRSTTAGDAGIEYGIYWVREVMKIWGDPAVFDRLDPDADEDILDHATQIVFADPGPGQLPGSLLDAANATVGQYDVFVDVRDRANTAGRVIVLRSRSYVPTKAGFLAGDRDASYSDVYARVRVRQLDAAAGNYSYFINHWGWFYGNSITANGSVRANGTFTLRSDPLIEGSPIYADAQGADLIDRLNDGGIFAGLEVDGTCRGMAGRPENQYEYQDPIVMPNLSDLTWYRRQATAGGGSLSIGGVELTGNGVYGDAAGEKQHLFLRGTPADPIRLNGTVVVEGALIISGTVTGQGALVVGDNVYIPDDITYLNPPTTWRPADPSEATTEAWIGANLGKDLVGLYSREHIVVGDYTNATWQNYVFSWLRHSLNRSDEDCGLDRIHSTRDTGECDGQWQTETYSQAHAYLNLIPCGSNVGDVIPASGEDVDGDGVRDGVIAGNPGWLTEFTVPASLRSANWGGNLPVAGPAVTLAYGDISTNQIGRLDGCFFTNHAFGAYITDPARIQINGALISRNESIVFSPRIEMNHDERLTGRSWEDLGIVGGGKVWDAITVEAWWSSDRGAGTQPPAP